MWVHEMRHFGFFGVGGQGQLRQVGPPAVQLLVAEGTDAERARISAYQLDVGIGVEVEVDVAQRLVDFLNRVADGLVLHFQRVAIVGQGFGYAPVELVAEPGFQLGQLLVLDLRVAVEVFGELVQFIAQLAGVAVPVGELAQHFLARLQKAQHSLSNGLFLPLLLAAQAR